MRFIGIECFEKKKARAKSVCHCWSPLSFSPSHRRKKEKCLISGIVSSPRVVRKVTKKLSSAPVSLLIFHHKSKKHASDKTPFQGNFSARAADAKFASIFFTVAPSPERFTRYWCVFRFSILFMWYARRIIIWALWQNESGKSDCRISAGALEITRRRACGDGTKDAAGGNAGDPYFMLTLQIARKIIAPNKEVDGGGGRLCAPQGDNAKAHALEIWCGGFWWW